jgi:hypothetical protein
MAQMHVRRYRTIVDETHIEIGREINPPVRYCAAMAVVENPYAGRYSEDLTQLEAIGAAMGEELGRRAVAALGIEPSAVASYGKAVIVGEAGEREHAAAAMHPTLGKPLREVLGGGAAIIPSAKKVAGPGASIDVPLHNKDDAWSFPHFDAMEVSVTGSPKADELVIIVAMADGGRPQHRVGEGLSAADVLLKGD